MNLLTTEKHYSLKIQILIIRHNKYVTRILSNICRLVKYWFSISISIYWRYWCCYWYWIQIFEIIDLDLDIGFGKILVLILILILIFFQGQYWYWSWYWKWNFRKYWYWTPIWYCPTSALEHGQALVNTYTPWLKGTSQVYRF